ncbi:MAG TPA: TrmH family RNA methyltransferase [Spirochaetota bacterium]|nr:TrmH family RNA methyltransferase [Spirochaetota bacterium]
MSFTKTKFSTLSKDNRIKKVIFAIKDFLESKKEAEYVNSLLSWLNEFDNLNLSFPSDYYSQGILLNALQNLIKTENSFIEEKCYDDVGRERKIFPIKLILNDIRSPFNVGSIFRTSEAFGVEEIVISGITPIPGKNPKIDKTIKNSYVKHFYTEDIVKTIKSYKSQGYSIISLEKTSNSTDISETNINFPIVLILGNEEFGVMKELLELSDKIVHIKMFGMKNSINVGIATGIALNTIIRASSFLE